jgi:hypothetical protein
LISEILGIFHLNEESLVHSCNVTMRLVISAAFYYTAKALLNPDSIQGPPQRCRYALAPTKRRSASFHLDETFLVRNETGEFNPGVWRSSNPLPFPSESLEREFYPPAAISTHKVSASIQNAIKQVHAIFDLYNSTATTSTSTADSLLSPDLALMTLQGVVFRAADSLYTFVLEV